MKVCAGTITSSPGPIPAAREGEREGGGPRRNPDAVRNLAVVGELTLEAVNLRAKDEAAVRDHRVERSVEVVAELVVLAGEVHEGHLAHRWMTADLVRRAHRGVTACWSSWSSARIARPAGSSGSKISAAASLRERTASFEKADVRWLLTVLVAR